LKPASEASREFFWQSHFRRVVSRIMTLEELRALARTSMTKPFVIRLTDGQAIRVSHPEFVGVPHDGQSFVYFPETGGWQFVFLNQVVSVDSVQKEEA
jgi:hypothetical protein